MKLDRETREDDDSDQAWDAPQTSMYRTRAGPNNGSSPLKQIKIEPGTPLASR